MDEIEVRNKLEMSPANRPICRLEGMACHRPSECLRQLELRRTPSRFTVTVSGSLFMSHSFGLMEELSSFAKSFSGTKFHTGGTRDFRRVPSFGNVKWRIGIWTNWEQIGPNGIVSPAIMDDVPRFRISWLAR